MGHSLRRRRALLAVVGATVASFGCAAPAAQAAGTVMLDLGGAASDVVRAHGGAFAGPDGAVQDPALGWHAVLPEADAWLDTSGTLTFFRDGWPVLSLADLEFRLGDTRDDVLARVDGAKTESSVFVLDTTGATLDVFDTELLSGVVNFRLSIGNTRLALSDAGAALLDAAYGTDAFEPDMPVGLARVTF